MAITRPMTPREEREANRTRDEVAALAALAALWWRRRQSWLLASAEGLSLAELTNRLRLGTLQTIGDIRARASEEGVSSAKRQLPSLALAVPSLVTLAGLYPAAITARRYAKDFGDRVKVLQGQGVPTGRAAVEVAAEMESRAAGIAGTEASQTHSIARRKAVKVAASKAGLVVLERWVTEFGPNTCERCDWADGETIRLGESFTEGVPGGVHPRCHCTSIFVYETAETAWLLTA